MIVALLHDVIEDCGVGGHWVKSHYGKRVSTLVEQLSTVSYSDETTLERRNRKQAKWERVYKSGDNLLIAVHLMDTLDNCLSWRMLNSRMAAWEKLPRWVWQICEFHIPFAVNTYPLVAKIMQEEVYFQYERGVEKGSWRDA
jgi:(p)ppGpp synthase/HD superfamily hydrolase